MIGDRGPSEAYSPVEIKNEKEIRDRFPRTIREDLAKLDETYSKIVEGKTNEKDLSRMFANLQPGPPGSHSSVVAYPITLKPGWFQKVRNPTTSKGENYYVEYKFVVSKGAGIVESKQRKLFGYQRIIICCMKPVIYFYPKQEATVSVHLYYRGNITVSYPAYDPKISGWRIRAYPDGKVINLADGEEYSYLFWEGDSKLANCDLSQGFVVEGKKSEQFLRTTLKKMGLTPREYNEFIVYWLPQLLRNEYNLIHFAHEEYEEMARLEVDPKPDSVLRVFMVYKATDKNTVVRAQDIQAFVRKGFSVVEWGGAELGESD